MGKIILTGDRPTGKLHVGHYVGSLRRRVELQNSGEFDKIYIMIADAQALTDNADNPEKVRQNILEVQKALGVEAYLETAAFKKVLRVVGKSPGLLHCKPQAVVFSHFLLFFREMG